MSLKAELETWAAALKAYDEDDYNKSLQLFSTIADSSKILTNIGLIYATLGEHEAAVEQFVAATQLDQYLAVAYFQAGVSNFLLSRFDIAFKDFDDALLYLRGNPDINYEQLGLKFKLYAAEVLFNKGLCNIYMGRVEEGLMDMAEARKEKVTEEHSVIDDAIQDRGDGYTVFSIPVGVLYRPSEAKLKNSKAKDYMGKAKLVAASDDADTFTEFSGVTRLKQGITPTGVFIDTDVGGLSRSATVAGASPKAGNEDKPMGLQRSMTTINVPADARDRIRAANGGGGGDSSAFSGAAAGASVSIAGPTRGLSIRKPGMDSPPAGPSTNGGSNKGPSRPVTDFYENYMDSYTSEDAPPPLPPTKLGAGAGGAVDRVANWRTNTASPQLMMQRSRSNAQGPPSSYSGGSMRRRPTRRATGRGPARAPSAYMYEEEEEEGYVSGDYDDGFIFEMTKIRVKIHYQDDVRGMAITPDVSFEEFLERVSSKFGKSFEGLGLKFKDEDGGKVSLRDDMDYELAIETARESAKGKPEGRLEMWCTDV